MKQLRTQGLLLVSALFLVMLVGSSDSVVALCIAGTEYAAGECAEGEAHHEAADSNWDWPQVQRDPQRTGYTPEVLGTDFDVAWSHAFHPERIYPQVQAIVYDGNVFVGTEMGNLYALDAKTGDQVWVRSIGAPIVNSVSAGEGKIFFGAMDGTVYALNAQDGSDAWARHLLWRHGFSTAPVLADGKVMLGGRDGRFYALASSSGNVAWIWPAENEPAVAPILQTAAWNNGRAFFGAMDMQVYAINTADGTLAWTSEKLSGIALKDYWPVVHQNTVLVRTMNGDTSRSLDNFYALDEGTGEEAVELPQYNAKTMHGATTPPAIDRDGYLVVPVPDPNASFKACWGRLDLATQHVVDHLNGSCGNEDENENVSSAQNIIIGLHVKDWDLAGANGVFDLDSRTWTNFRMDTDYRVTYNTQGAGGNPASISDGMIYHIAFHYLIARTTE
jgi:outer membrane protein assembly factor BamB